jgi:hypothetical protein
MGQPGRKQRKAPSASAAIPAAESAGAPQVQERWEKPAGMGKIGWAVLAGAIALVNLPLVHRLVRPAPSATLALPYEDDFSSPSTVAAHYFSTGGQWRTQSGELFSPGVRNNPLWLKAKLPQNVVIDFDARSASPEGDIRVEVFGNGVDHLSGYELIQGGWNNTLSAIVRLEENSRTMSQLQADAQRVASRQGLRSPGLVETGIFKPDTPVRVDAHSSVRPQKKYHWRIERRGSALRWSIDGQPFLELDDPFPLTGSGHDRFGFSSTESDIYYDNLRIVPLENAAAPAPPLPPIAAPAVRPPPGPFADDFERAAVGSDWLATEPSAARIELGALTLQRAYNHPVWLTRPIPNDASIEFDCWSDNADGDIKVESWGDGTSYHYGRPHEAYVSTGYVFIFGGWRNTTSVLARQSEHSQNRASRSDVKVEPGKRYHWRIARRGNRIDWYIDGQTFLSVEDPSPLSGPDHQFFAFSGFESKVHFDNLRIEPL